MNRLSIVMLLLLSSVSSVSYAGTGDQVPLCPVGAPADCVTSNWGQVEPDGIDGSIARPTKQSIAAAPTANLPRIAVQRMPVAAPTGTMTSNTRSTVKAVVSPKGLFAKETDALTSALKRARFNGDGSIVSGEAAIARAAAGAQRKAGNKYFLTIYVKVPQTLSPDEGGLLDKQVRSVNDILVGPGYAGSSGKPKS